MRQEQKLSIIIPAYNAENYISRCLDSILNQDYHNEIEIIVVNDGSEDKTAEILENYRDRYPGLFRVITKRNEGVSSARNAGILASLGEWIWFCDADDYVCKEGLSFVLDNFVDSDIDVCSFCSVTLDGIALKNFSEPERVKGDCVFEGTTISRFKETSPFFVWNHIYRKSAIDGVMFREIPLAEDALFNLEVYMKDLRLRCTNANIYRYTISAGQSTRKRDQQTMKNAIHGYEGLFDTFKRFQSEVEDNELIDAIDEKIAGQSLPFMSRVLCAELSKDEFAILFHRLNEKGIFPFSEINSKIRIVNLIGRCPDLYMIGSLLYKRLFVPYILPRLSRN